MRVAAVTLALAMLAGCAGGPRLNDRQTAFLGNAANPSAVIAAELAFARMAREKGTWTAFRETATEDALWPTPGWENVRASLKGVPDPAQAIVWEPDQIWSSCDGSFALSSGPATYPSGRKTRFATIWQRQDDRTYRWVLDQGFELEPGYAKPDMIAARVAECGERRRGPPPQARRSPTWQSGQSDDGTLAWTSELAADCSRSFTVHARRGGTMVVVFSATSPPPPATPAGQTPPTCAP